jgi:N-acetyl-beta-hexosaminidase
VTAFEAFEHFVDPILETEKMFAIGPTILFSTTLCPTPTPAHNDWWYYGKEHGQHISLYRVQSLRMLANRFNAKLITNGVDLHILTRRDISERRWQLFTNRRIVRFIPFLIQKRLASKTWSDHEIMARSQTTRLA